MSISLRTFSKASSIRALAVLLLAASAVAQDAKGEFTLSKEVRWGNATLTPGSYVYSLEHHASEILIVRPAAGGTGFVMMPVSISRPRSADSDSLLLERKGDSWFVSSLTVRDLDEQLLFRAPAVAAPVVSHTTLAASSAP